jgi:hypothetical protein
MFRRLIILGFKSNVLRRRPRPIRYAGALFKLASNRLDAETVYGVAGFSAKMASASDSRARVYLRSTSGSSGKI